MVEDTRVAVHPAVHVALERNHDLDGVERPGGAHVRHRLTDVELLVRGRGRVDVVERRVAVQDVELLSDLDAQHVRHVDAALLVQDDRLGRHREAHAFEAALDVHEGVLQAALHVRDHELGHHRAVVHSGAVGVRGHLDGVGRRGLAVEHDRAADGPGGGRIHGGHGGGRNGLHRGVRFAATAAADHQGGGEGNREQNERARGSLKHRARNLRSVGRGLNCGPTGGPDRFGPHLTAGKPTQRGGFAPDLSREL